MLAEALLRAKVMGARFSKQQVLVVPFDRDDPGGGAGSGGGGGRGFARADAQAYVAQPSDDAAGGGSLSAWRAYADAEVASAAAQAGLSEDELWDQGVVVVASKDGRIVRRGLGMPAWDLIARELNAQADDAEA